MIVGRSVLEKSDRITWHSEWISCREKFSEKSIQAFSSRNQTWEGLESTREEEEEEALERRGFRDGVDLCLGAIEQLIERERERERERTNRKIPTQININKKCYVCIKNAWTCGMQKKKHHGLSPIQSYQHTWFQHSKHTSIMHETL